MIAQAQLIERGTQAIEIAFRLIASARPVCVSGIYPIAWLTCGDERREEGGAAHPSTNRVTHVLPLSGKRQGDSCVPATLRVQNEVGYRNLAGYRCDAVGKCNQGHTHWLATHCPWT